MKYTRICSPEFIRVKRTTKLHSALCTASRHLLLLKFLLRNFFLLGFFSTTGESLLLLPQADLDVAGAAHVRVDPTVGPVGPASHLGGAVHLK